MPRKNTLSSKRKSSPRRRSSHRSKNRISRTKTLYLSLAVVVVCAALIAASILFAAPQPKETEVSIAPTEERNEADARRPETPAFPPEDSVQADSAQSGSAQENSTESGSALRENGTSAAEQTSASSNKTAAASRTSAAEHTSGTANKTSAAEHTPAANKTSAAEHTSAANKTSVAEHTTAALAQSAATKKSAVKAVAQKTAAQSSSAQKSTPHASLQSAQQTAAHKSAAQKTAVQTAAKVPAGGGAIEPNNGQQIKPQPLFVIPDAKSGATLYFVFDDAGQNVKALEKYTTLPFPVAVAVLPKLTYSKQCAQKIRASGNIVMLHQPMQALNANINPGPGAITPDMGVRDIMKTVRTNIAEIGPVAGLNNHEGSRITENEIQIGAVLDEAASEHVFFLDSRTTAQTRAPQAALERGMSIYERDVFLDDTVNRAEILKQLYRALDIANKKGKAVIIGHVDKSADIIPALLREMYPDLIKKGYRFGKLK